MLQRISGRLTDLLLEKEIIKSDDREIYVYGFLAMLSTVINFFIILFIGIAAGLFLETLIYLMGFALLRSYCGGYHAETQLCCAIGLTIIYGISMIFYRVLPIEYSSFFSIIFSAFCVTFIFLVAPIEHKNRTLSKKEFKQFKIVSRILAIVYFLIICTISLLFNAYMMIAVVLTLVMLSVSLVLALAIVLYERSEP